MKLEQKGIEYTECQDMEKMKELGIVSLPVVDFDGNLLTFEKAVKFVNER